jgi:hypothetical protein
MERFLKDSNSTYIIVGNFSWKDRWYTLRKPIHYIGKLIKVNDTVYYTNNNIGKLLVEESLKVALGHSNFVVANMDRLILC